jgi:3-oxoacyl-[acyl-carrier-protein] synthase-3
MHHSRFEALGACLPEASLSTADLLARLQCPLPFNLEAITGIRNRRVHDKRDGSFEDSFVLAQLAAEDALRRSRYAPEDLDVIISASITRYRHGYSFYFEPSFAALLTKSLGARSAIHLDVTNACAGMFTGVHLLDRMIRAGIVRNGLVVSGECITPVADTAVKEVCEPLDPQFASLTVGDAGVAIVLDRAVDDADKIHYIDMVTYAEYAKLCIGMPSDKNDSSALYTVNQQMHHEDRLTLVARSHKAFMERRGLDFESEKFDYIIHHQVGSRFIKAMQKLGSRVFGCEMPESIQYVEEFGNTASTAHFLALHEHLKHGKFRKGSKVLMAPAASGVVTGCLSATISSLRVGAPHSLTFRAA